MRSLLKACFVLGPRRGLVAFSSAVTLRKTVINALGTFVRVPHFRVRSVNVRVVEQIVFEGGHERLLLAPMLGVRAVNAFGEEGLPLPSQLDLNTVAESGRVDNLAFVVDRLALFFGCLLYT